MAFTAQDVKKLREMTNVGMMDCKKALQATDGDMDKAVDWLREKGPAKAAKKAGRVAAEGMAYAEVCAKCGAGAVVEVNCETDFCAKSELFVAFVKDICHVVLKDAPADVDALMQCKYPGSELTVAETLPEKVMSIGENLQIRRFARHIGTHEVYVRRDSLKERFRKRTTQHCHPQMWVLLRQGFYHGNNHSDVAHGGETHYKQMIGFQCSAAFG